MTWDSKYTGGCLKPFEQKGGRSGEARSVVGTKAGRNFRSMKERAEDSAGLTVSVNTSRSNDTLLLARNPEWIKGGERQKWSGVWTRTLSWDVLCRVCPSENVPISRLGQGSRQGRGCSRRGRTRRGS